eukprot:Protomagalhaensia_wolfi_Nauph_80__2783@NODE_28_length_4653_cov_149_967490_g23_i0_p4_GENE_NODE_28_length_4653_cov_149_967490_g23_i0NODE_28_length_4653_cov_149_967490_g23_i0_p4_ORF_typecomplete_len225_score12_83_NODE_28_length_4653_cov_149_967490_g23_i025243198
MMSSRRRINPAFSEISSDEYYQKEGTDSQSTSSRGSFDSHEPAHSLILAPPHVNRYALRPPEMVNTRRELNGRLKSSRQRSGNPPEDLGLVYARKTRHRIHSNDREGTFSSPRPRKLSTSSSSSDSEVDLRQHLIHSYGNTLPYYSPQGTVFVPPGGVDRPSDLPPMGHNRRSLSQSEDEDAQDGYRSPSHSQPRTSFQIPPKRSFTSSESSSASSSSSLSRRR